MSGLVAFVSVKGSPGVTATAVAVGACWPSDAGTAVVVEADPAGGDLAAVFALSPAVGLLSLAAASRHGGDADMLWRHTTRLPGGLAVVAGPIGAGKAHAALVQLATGGFTPVLAAAAQAETVVLADCGRMNTGHPATGLLTVAQRIVVVAGTDVVSLAHLAVGVEALAELNRAVEVVLVGPPGPYRAAETAAAVGVRIAAVVPQDRDGAARVLGCGGGRRSRGRSVRAATDLAVHLAVGLGARVGVVGHRGASAARPGAAHRADGAGEAR